MKKLAFSMLIYFYVTPVFAFNCISGPAHDGYRSPVFNRDYSTAEPKGIAVDSKSNAFVIVVEEYDRDSHERIIIRKRSSDGQRSTVFRSTEVDSYDASGIAVDSQDRIFALGQVYGSNPSGKVMSIIIKSEDEGNSWSQSTALKDINFRSIAINEYDELYVAGTIGSDFVVMKSIDHAITWSEILKVNRPIETAYIKAKGNTVVVGYDTNDDGNNGIHVSNDGGSTWNTSSSEDVIIPVIINADSILMMGDSGTREIEKRELRVDRSLDGGKTWQKNFFRGTLGYYFNQDALIGPDGYIYSVGRGAREGTAIRKSSTDFSYTDFYEDIDSGDGTGGFTISKDGSIWTTGIDDAVHYDFITQQYSSCE